MGRKLRVDELVAELTSAADFEKMVDKGKWDLPTMLRMLRSRRGRRVIGRRRRMAMIHSQLVATRYAPFAVQRLCQLLMDKKSEVGLKSAMSIVGLAGLSKGFPKKREGEKREGKELVLSDEEARAILEALGKKEGKAKRGT